MSDLAQMASLILPPMEEEQQEAPFDTISDIAPEWLSPEGFDSLPDIASLRAEYADDDTEHISALQRVIIERKRLKDRVAELFRKELPEYLRSMTPYAEVMLNLADMFDDVQCGASDAKLNLLQIHRQAEAGVKILRLRRRQQNLKKLLEAAEFVQLFVQKFDGVMDQLEAGQFAETAKALGVQQAKDLSRQSAFREKNKGPSSGPMDSLALHGIEQLVTPGGADDEAQYQDWFPSQPQAAQLCQTKVGRFVILRWAKCNANASLILMQQMHEVTRNQFIPAQFSTDALVSVLGALRQLNVPVDVALRFAAEDFQDYLDECVYTRCCTALEEVSLLSTRTARQPLCSPSEMYDTWEQLADHLDRANDVEQCTLAMVDGASIALCGALHARKECIRYYDLPVPKSDGSEGPTSPQTPGHIIRSEMQNYVAAFGSSLDSVTSQRCLVALVAFVSRAQVSQLPLDSMFAVFRLILFFLDGLSEACPDASIKSTRQALSFQCSRILSESHETATVDALMKILALENFMSFHATVDDFPPLYPLSDEEQDKQLVQELLKRFRAPDESVSASWDELWQSQLGGSFGVENRKRSDSSPGRMGIQARIFEAFPIFTFSSYETCKRMLQFAAAAHRMPSAANDLMCSISYFACVYVWFLAVHFASKVDSISLEDDPNVPGSVRMEAKEIRTRAMRKTPSGYPNFPEMPCHEWKVRAVDPNACYAAKERATALCSLEPIVFCHQLCLGALATGGMAGFDSAGIHASLSAKLASFVKYCVSTALRRLSQNLLAGESIVALIERQRWDIPPKGVLLGEPSPFVSAVVETLHGMNLKLRDSFGDDVSKALHRIVEMAIFNILCGFVEGCSRIRKFADPGRAQLLTDVLQLTQRLKSAYPFTPTKLTDYAVRYVRAMISGGDGIIPLVTQYHALYTTNQLIRLAERDGGSARRGEVEAILRNAHHEDRVPFSLLE